MKKNTIIDGIAASEHLDSSGESLSIKGMDISSLGGPDSILNWEHGSKDKPSQVVGKVTFARKILKKSDAKNKRETYFWNKIKKPFVYIKAELFDSLGHSGAQDVAAMLKYKNKDKGKESRLVVGFSIEGGKIDKKGMVVTKSIARDVAITVKPCNKVCDAELIEDEVDDSFLYKNNVFECEILKKSNNSINLNSLRSLILEDIKKGDVIRFPGSFRSEKTDQAMEVAQANTFMENPNINEVYKKPHFQALHERFKLDPEYANFYNLILQTHSDTHDEPYQYGDIHDLVWGNNDKLKKQNLWNKPFPVPTEINVKKVGGILGKGVETGSGSDPFMWMDKKYKTGLNAIKAHKGLPLEINTRSDLIAHDEYMKNLDPENHVINFHFLGDNDRLNKKLEPGAPSVKRRMSAAKKLMDAGFKVNLIHNKLDYEGKGFDFNNFDEQNLWKLLGGRLGAIKTKTQPINKNSIAKLERALGIGLLGKSENFNKKYKVKNNMRKALIAGMMGGTPDSRTGGAVLASEEINSETENVAAPKLKKRKKLKK